MSATVADGDPASPMGDAGAARGEDSIFAAGRVGELFWAIDVPVLLVDRSVERVRAVNAAAATLLGLSMHQVRGAALADALPWAAPLLTGARPGGQRVVLDGRRWGHGVYHVTTHLVGSGPDAAVALLLADHTNEHRQLEALRALNTVSRDLLSLSHPPELYQRIADEAKRLLGAAFSTVIVLRSVGSTEVAHFAYNAPRHLFPDRLPRVVGLLAVPVLTAQPARIPDIRGHPAGVGIPVEHPPIGPLLGVPVLVHGQVVGEVAVANSPGQRVFDDVDEAVLTELAAHAGLALRLAQHQEAARQTEQMRADLVRLALHNIRTPVTGAMAAARMLRRRDDLRPDQKESLYESLEASLVRIVDLAENSVLQSVKEPAGAGDPAAGPPVAAAVAPLQAAVPAGTVLHETCAAAGQAAHDRDVRVELRVDPAVAEVEVDPVVVQLALDNLLSNALRHAPDGSTVSVVARPEDVALRVDVTDEGPGVPVDQQEQIFHGTGRSSGGGLGIGLATTRRLLAARGGHVGLTSQPGEGATFWITVPVARSG